MQNMCFCKKTKIFCWEETNSLAPVLIKQSTMRIDLIFHPTLQKPFKAITPSCFSMWILSPTWKHTGMYGGWDSWLRLCWKLPQIVGICSPLLRLSRKMIQTQTHTDWQVWHPNSGDDGKQIDQSQAFFTWEDVVSDNLFLWYWYLMVKQMFIWYCESAALILAAGLRQSMDWFGLAVAQSPCQNSSCFSLACRVQWCTKRNMSAMKTT